MAVWWEQQSVVVGPGNAHFISLRQVSSDESTLPASSAAAAAAATAAANGDAVYRLDDSDENVFYR